mmetsp:Transcript_52217/g.131087  ORF Transcript_52217/g.131087 Transcript_52217/m.131087 type:complete len:290 (+) Transcript_52217:340-1209(+)
MRLASPAAVASVGASPPHRSSRSSPCWLCSLLRDARGEPLDPRDVIDGQRSGGSAWVVSHTSIRCSSARKPATTDATSADTGVTEFKGVSSSNATHMHHRLRSGLRGASTRCTEACNWTESVLSWRRAWVWGSGCPASSSMVSNPSSKLDASQGACWPSGGTGNVRARATKGPMWCSTRSRMVCTAVNVGWLVGAHRTASSKNDSMWKKQRRRVSRGMDDNLPRKASQKTPTRAERAAALRCEYKWPTSTTLAHRHRVGARDTSGASGSTPAGCGGGPSGSAAAAGGGM